MNKALLDEIVKHIEKLIKQSDESEYVKDARGSYLKVEYMSNLVAEAKGLIKYGEFEIALENMLENLSEVSIFIDEETANLARQAFGSKISVKMQKIINSLVKEYQYHLPGFAGRCPSVGWRKAIRLLT